MLRNGSKYLITVLLVAFSFAALGCMAGYRSTTKNGHETVYKVDDDGNKTLIYEIDPDGAVTIHDETDPRAQQLMKAEAARERAEAADVERIELIKAAPKRAQGEAILVAIHSVELGPKLKEAQHSQGAVTAEVLKNFESDKVIQLVSVGDTNSQKWTQIAKMYSGQSANQAPESDVTVVTKARLKEVFGVSKSSGKPASAWYIVYEATVRCNYLPNEYAVTEEGNMFRNVEVTKRFTDKIKAVIKNDIGPTLPADRSL